MPEQTTRAGAAPNRWVWPFELLDKLGEGGMGVVYRARYVVNNRLVAVKMLPEDLADSAIPARFERELEILKSLKHPNIVRCFGGVCENKRRFYAMELVEGGTLDSLLRQKGRLSWEQVIEYGLQMCAALTFLHEHQIVHRDIKPSNFLIAQNGLLKLSDFGLAWITTTQKITKAGFTLGTYHYMAPEQIHGKEVSAQTDLYALGCVLFEMLTGRTPFDGDTPAEILQKHIKQSASRVTAWAPDCPAALEQLIVDLLQKKAADRPDSALSVSRRLRNITQTVVVPAKPRSRNLPGSTVSNQPTVGRSSEKDSDTAVVTGNTTVAESLPVWTWWGTVTAAILLLVWNLSLVGERRILQRSEAFWIDTFHGEQEELTNRLKAAGVLGELASESSNAFQALIDGLDDEMPLIRQTAIEALATAGAEARPAINRLMRIQKHDEDRLVRSAAQDALVTIRNAEPTASRFPLFAVPVFILGGILVWHFVRKSKQDTSRKPASRPSS